MAGSSRGPSRRQAHGGHTLIELAVVISIIVLLLAILLPTFASVRSRARYAKWQGYSHNLRTDPRMVGYYNFEQQDGEETDANGRNVIWNRAEGDPIALARKVTEPQDYNGILGNGNVDPTLNPKWDFGRWKGKGSLSFDGTDDYALHRIPVPGRRFTVFHWALPKTTDENVIFYDGNGPEAGNESKYDGFGNTSPDGYELHTTLRLAGSNSRGHVFLQNSSGAGPDGKVNVNGPDGELKTDQWFFLAATFNSTTSQMQLFVDTGSPVVGNQSQPSGLNKRSFGYLGATGHFQNLARRLDGVLDEVGVMNAVMEQSEAEQMYRVGKTRSNR